MTPNRLQQIEAIRTAKLFPNDGWDEVCELIEAVRLIAPLLKASAAAWQHVNELREAWRTGALCERDNLGGTRSNRNVDVEVGLRKALDQARQLGFIVYPDTMFRCPKCYGAYFGRDIGPDKTGLPTVRCHDEFKKGCKWRGVWPEPKEPTP